ncbi:ABC transporter permease [Actinophytocola oryzae]|uniref:Carbohydrate ABC transporter membrane protein 1 (CUT1 family) n=1 Tax=Actinophytocola oryzae TaxID=502181 RepID=A0A4R7VKB7_9PSEU|nr:ABC transporter permease subunit [Actinophytocola oryzae]TDV49687.1 carbohydrate ABC transporter membrane protein 1 (CUT1 family) [Actinophytocola oryzae]
MATHTTTTVVTTAVHRGPAPRPGRRRPGLLTRLRTDRAFLLLAVPGLVLILVFHYVPLLGNVIAFQDYQPFIPITEAPWVGFDNFSVIFDGDPAFLNALTNTLVISFLQIVVVFPIPIALALLLDSLASEKVRRFVQSVVYLPHFMSWVIVVAVFQSMLSNTGLLNNLITDAGGSPVNIIGDPELFRTLVTSQVIWKDTGWSTILFVAALSQVDHTLYEASEVDGASRLRQLWHVTLPGIRGVVVLVLILRLGDVLSVGFEQIVLQMGAVGPTASEVLDTYVYNNGILNGEWGTSAAVGLVKGVVGLALILIANKVAHLIGENGIYQR